MDTLKPTTKQLSLAMSIAPSDELWIDRRKPTSCEMKYKPRYIYAAWKRSNMTQFADYVKQIYLDMLEQHKAREHRTVVRDVEKNYQLFLETLPNSKPEKPETVRRPVDYSPADGPRTPDVNTKSVKSKSEGDPRSKKNGGAGRSIKRICWTFRASIKDTSSIEEQADELCAKLIETCEKYAFQAECAPTTGYKHFQGYFELLNKNRFEWIQKNIRKFEYLMERKGSPKQAWTYATKQETRIAGPWILGEPTVNEMGNNKASDLFVQDIKKGHSDDRLSSDHPSLFLQRVNSINRLRGDLKPVRTSPLEVYLFYGPPGTGKTEFAYQQGVLAGYQPYELPIGKDFWTTPYMYGKKWIILDEFKSNLTLKDLLSLLDNRPIEAPMKQSFQWWCPDVVVITSNISPWNWYHYNDRDYERQALFRRLKTGGVYKFEKNEEKKPTPVEIDIEDKFAFGEVAQQVTRKRKLSPMEEYFQYKMALLRGQQPMMGLMQQPANHPLHKKFKPTIAPKMGILAGLQTTAHQQHLDQGWMDIEPTQDDVITLMSIDQ